MGNESAGAKLRVWRESNGVTMAELAKALGVGIVTVHGWETDHRDRPNAARREALERATGGAVPAAAWETERDREQAAKLAAVLPLGMVKP